MLTTLSCPSALRRPRAGHVAALVLTLALAACGGGGATPPDAQPLDGGLVAARPGQLTAYVQERLRQAAARGTLQAGAALAGLPSGGGTALDAGQRSATMNQEAGVDEDDLLKADAARVYTLHERTLRLDRLGATLEREQALALPSFGAHAQDTVYRGLQLAPASTRLAVLGEHATYGEWQGCGGEVCPALVAPVPVTLRTVVQMVELDGPARLGRLLEIDGALLGSRRIGDRLVLVTVHQAPLAATALAGATPAEVEARIAALAAADLLPTLRVDRGAPVPLVSETQCWLQPANASQDVALTTVTVLDLADPQAAPSSLCIAGGTEAMLMTARSLVLATTRWAPSQVDGMTVFPPAARTDLHRFALDGTLPAYRASGDVAGHLGWHPDLRRYRLSEHGDLLRVLTFTGQVGWAAPDDPTRPNAPAPSPATLTVLREDAATRTLTALAQLPNAQRPALLGKPGEQVYGVHFAGTRAYLVTFELVDPLYVLDLSNPADPQAAGALEVPGVSDHLLPLADGWLLGIGHDVDGDGQRAGLQLALFDVRDPAQPRLSDSRTLGEAGSFSAIGHGTHGLSMLMRSGRPRIGLPVALRQAEAYVQGLLRIDADLAAGTLAVGSPVEAPGAPPGPDLADDRNLQLDDRVVYLSRGTLTLHDW